MPRNRALVPLQVAGGNPLAAKLVALLPFNGIKRDLISGNYIFSSPETDKFKPSARGGLSVRSDGTLAASIPINLSAYNKITVSFWLYWDAFANDDALAFEFGTTGGTQLGNGFFADPNSSSGSFEASAGASGVSGSKRFPRSSAKTWRQYTIGYDRTLSGSIAFAYVDGVPQALTAVATGTVNGNFANGTLYLLSRTATSLFGTGNLQDLAIFGSLLSEAERVSLYQRPDQLYAAPARRIFFGRSAVGATLVGAAGAQANTAGAGAIAQHHRIVGAPGAQANAAGTGSAAQHHRLIGAAAAQANSAGTGAAKQTHRLAGAAAAQANAAQASAVVQHHRIVGAAATQANTSSTGAIGARAELAGAPGAQANSASAGAVAQHHGLTGALATQSNPASVGAIRQHHKIVAAASVQDSVAAASAVVQHHVLHGAAATQANTGSAGAVRVPFAGAGATAAEIWSYVLPTGRTAAQTLIETQQMVSDLYRIHGLIPGEPLVVGPSSRTAGALVQSIAEVAGVVTVARSP